MTAPSPGYRRLALGTAAATFLLIVLGGVVRVSDSGLGCGPAGSGFKGWPLCAGDVLPGLDLNTVIEYCHRLVAGALTLMVFTLALLAWRRYRSHRALLWTTTAAAALIVGQALLGAATVEHDLNETLVASHLGIAMLLLGLALYAWRAARPSADVAPAGTGFRALAVAASAAVLCTIVAGGYMAGTDGRGRAHAAEGAHHACGTQFPACNDGFLPFGQSRLVNIHLVHRTFMYLAVVLLIALVAVALRRRPSGAVVRLAGAVVGLLVVQVLLGALNVWLATEYELLILAHLAVGTLLWAAAAGLTFQLFRVPEPAGARAARRPPEAVTA
ncbi:MAG: heme A synthase [Thermoleophilaceae bacterium]